MTTAKSDTIASRISRTLAERIIAGTIAAGAKLRQDHIAEEFSASHVPVREAFRRLESQGLVVSEPRRGVRVAGFSLDEVKEVAEMRAALEVLALRHAAPHLTKAILDAAEAATRAGDKAGDVQAWEEANRAFHKLILRPCGMPRLLNSIDDLHPRKCNSRAVILYRSSDGAGSNHHADLRRNADRRSLRLATGRCKGSRAALLRLVASGSMRSTG